MSESQYSDVSIHVLSDLEAIRTRPGMYVGDPTNGPQLLLQHLLNFEVSPFELVSLLEVTIHQDASFEVVFYEQFIPISYTPEEGCPTIKRYYETFDTPCRAYGINPNATTNFLSEWFELDICDGTKRYQQRFERGVPQPPKITEEPSELSYTRLWYRPDPTIFPPLEESGRKAIFDRLEELSFLLPGLEVLYEDQIAGQKAHLYTPKGLLARLEKLSQEKAPIFSAPMYLSDVIDGVEVQLLLQWVDDAEYRAEAYTNQTRNRDGGMHVMGIYEGLRRVLSGYLKKDLTSDQLKQGLRAIVAVQLERPMFSGPQGDKLVSIEAKRAVSQLIQQRLPALLEARHNETEVLLQKLAPTLQLKREPRKTSQRRLRMARKAAQNPETKPEALTVLSELRDPQVNAAILLNPNTPLELLLKLAVRRPRLFWKNPITPLLFLSDPAFLMTLPAKLLRPLVKKKEVSISLLEQLQAHPERSVRALPLECPTTPNSMLRFIQASLRHGEATLQIEIFLHPNCDEEVRETIWKSPEWDFKSKLANDRRTPTITLERLLRENYHEVAVAAASNPKLPEQYFADLAKGSARVRSALARNPNTPPQILSRLACDSSFWVRTSAAKNPSTPQEIVKLLQRTGAHQELLGCTIPLLQDETLSKEELAHLAERGNFARWLVWHHPNATKELKERCEKSGWFQARRLAQELAAA